MYNKLMFLISTTIMLITGCTNEKNLPIKCLSEFIEENVDKQKLKNFTHLDSIYIWREWSDLTSHLAEERQTIDDCGLYEYMDNLNESMDSLRGQIIFVHSIHHYIRDGYINQKEIVKEVDKLISASEE